jgi:hypothetical protein
MQIENTENQAPVKQNDSYGLGFSTTSWNITNLGLITTVSTAMVLSIQMPFKTLLLNLMKYNVVIPPVSPYTGGLLSIFKAYYAGTQASLTSATARNLYVNSNRNGKPSENTTSEEMNEKSVLAKPNVKPITIAAGALADVVLTQVPESLSQLRKIPGLIPAHFKWYTPYNFAALFANGIMARYSASVISYSAMLQFENKIANRLPIKNQTTNHGVAGALSGMGAAIFSYPFSVFKDYLLMQTTITNERRLVNKGSLNTLKELGQRFTGNPKQAIEQFAKLAKTQLPLKTLLSGAIFATITATEQALGPEPLAKIIPKPISSFTKNHPSCFFAASVKKPTMQIPDHSEPRQSPF